MLFPLILMNILNKTDSGVLLILYVLSIPGGSVCPDYFGGTFKQNLIWTALHYTLQYVHGTYKLMD